MRVNWFSPLPPAHTEIANYTARLLPDLCAQCDVVLWTDQQNWSPDLERYASVRRYKADDIPWSDINQGDAAIYHIGNNADFHAAIWRFSRCHPGIIVLHDTRLHDFFAGVYLRPGMPEEYQAQMAKHYGHRGAAAAAGVLDGSLSVMDIAELFPLTDLALENALGVVVHTRPALGELTRKGRWPATYAPLPYAARPAVATPESRDKGRAPFDVVIFGFIGANRRVEAVLNAFHRFPRREAFRLSIYGKLEDEANVLGLIHSMNLSAQVAVHGYVSEEQLDGALAASHLSFNLRYPSMGEASAAQLRIWSHGLPSAVTQVGWYATQPADTVLFVRPDHEEDDLRSILERLLTDSHEVRRIGQNGRRHLEQHHSVSGYVQALLHLAQESPKLRSRVMARKLIERAAVALSPWSYPGPLVNAYRHVAEQVHRLTTAA